MPGDNLDKINHGEQNAPLGSGSEVLYAGQEVPARGGLHVEAAVVSTLES
jgi:hypothetical protein